MFTKVEQRVQMCLDGAGSFRAFVRFLRPGPGNQATKVVEVVRMRPVRSVQDDSRKTDSQPFEKDRFGNSAIGHDFFFRLQPFFIDRSLHIHRL